MENVAFADLRTGVAVKRINLAAGGDVLRLDAPALGEPATDMAFDLPGNLLLKLKNVVQPPVKAFVPDFRTVIGPNQVRVHANTLAVRADARVDQIVGKLGRRLSVFRRNLFGRVGPKHEQLRVAPNCLAGVLPHAGDKAPIAVVEAFERKHRHHRPVFL